MTNLTIGQVAQLCKTAGFTGDALVNAVAVCMAESGGRTTATHANFDQWNSVDRGLFQINDHYHPEVTAAQAFDPVFNVAYAYTLSKHGANWSGWLAFTSTAYKTWLPKAQVAVANLSHPTVRLTDLYFTAANDSVLLVQKALIARHLLDPSMATGYYYINTREAYHKFQVSLGYSGSIAQPGSDADGIPGRTSLEKLGFNVI